ncbi:MAG: hypothetical protein IJ773_01330 [Lachnospiraceae bacterium]|nr:hypothetical protein [Lachnospiraceae bacterium]
MNQQKRLAERAISIGFIVLFLILRYLCNLSILLSAVIALAVGIALYLLVEYYFQKHNTPEE